MSIDKKNLIETIGWIVFFSALISIIGYLFYYASYKQTKVCETYSSVIRQKAHEVESINNFGATRNNYYLYLDNGTRQDVDLDIYTLANEGNTYEYVNCWLETIK
jgi:hypothetical protein